MINEFVKAREEYISEIKAELLGPGSEITIPDAEHELISTSPEKRYSMGILYPQDNKMNADEDDTERNEESSDGDGEDELFDALEEDENKEQSSTKVQNDESDNESEEDYLDETVSLASQNLPSSMGLTFFAKGNSEILEGILTFGIYEKARLRDCMIPVHSREEVCTTGSASGYLQYDDTLKVVKLKASISRKEIAYLKENGGLEERTNSTINALYGLAQQLKNGYIRIPCEERFNIIFGKADYYEGPLIEKGKAQLRITAFRRKITDTLYSVTIMLVNECKGKPSGNTCVFQPHISIATKQNNFLFCDYTSSVDFVSTDEEEQSLALQYRNKRVYGTGLGTSLDWTIDQEGNGEIHTNFFPEYEVPSVDFNLDSEYKVPEQAFSMKYLSDLEDHPQLEKIECLNAVIDAYKKWIDKLEASLEILDKKYLSIASKNIDGCKAAYERMKRGIEILSTNKIAWDSFELANRAMFMQRAHIKMQEKFSKELGAVYPGNKIVEDFIRNIDYRNIDAQIKDRYSWRPFQLAFMILSIDSITNDDGNDRQLVDLIWFPTGGGKTEAYLGLTAFTIFYRRLAHAKMSGGTAVIMRYTLRLLAAQQFTRASTLICACEYIRQDSTVKRPKRPKYKSYPLGETEINIGLWIGGEHTPNRNSGANDHLKKLLEAKGMYLRDAKEKHNKFQVLKCPWCGTKMTKDWINGKDEGAWGYNMKNGKRFYLSCTNNQCVFNLRLPIQIVDEELYAAPPTLLFGTVDKFAMLPWINNVGAFLGCNSANRTPELIIQDELHLISGPLGTMVGLYESAIDFLCAEKGVPSKIIASTATIRRAKQQCGALYDREVMQFPHPGLDAEDSFFSREAKVDIENGKTGRRYIGLMPAGKTKAMMEIRSLAALLQCMHKMDIKDEIKDKYWTVTAYFNSLKDLGKCSTLLDDDVKDFIKRIAYRNAIRPSARFTGRADELTSRVSTTELNETLDKLEKIEYKSDPETGKANIAFASNTLIATNMISVGIDVARLNVMLLVGQPKLTSEYIQASSRVGRTFPGVAFAMYDSTKSRDRSHYEQFRPYHEAFYRYVEPTGVTPFSGPVRERALHAVIVSMMRHKNPNLLDEGNASSFNKVVYAQDIAEVKDYLLNRNKSVVKRLGLNVQDETSVISEEIDTFFDKWEMMADAYGKDHFSYGNKYLVKSPNEGEGRLIKPYNTSPEDDAIDTMTSMRNVDITVGGNIIIWEEEK